MRNSETIVLSLPIDVINKIKLIQGDLPRSLVYRRLLEKALGVNND